MKQRYIILSESEEHYKKIWETLFGLGYVFNCHARSKEFSSVSSYYPVYKVIGINFYKKCSNVLYILSVRNDYDHEFDDDGNIVKKSNPKVITLEDFITQGIDKF